MALRIVLHGDFGNSITTRRTISVEIFKRLPATIYLAVTAVLVSLVIAIPLGTIAAVDADARQSDVSESLRERRLRVEFAVVHHPGQHQAGQDVEGLRSPSPPPRPGRRCLRR